MRLPPGKVRPGVHIAYMPKGRQPCTDEIQLLQIAASSTEAVVRNRGRNVRKGLVRIWVGGMLEWNQGVQARENGKLLPDFQGTNTKGRRSEREAKVTWKLTSRRARSGQIWENFPLWGDSTVWVSVNWASNTLQAQVISVSELEFSQEAMSAPKSIRHFPARPSFRTSDERLL
jgi:hypothetical protein